MENIDGCRKGRYRDRKGRGRQKKRREKREW